MNQIIAVIPRESLEPVRSALLALDVGGLTLSELFEPTGGMGSRDEWWGLGQDGVVRLEVISIPEHVDEITGAITAWVNETAQRPRGIIFVAQLDSVVRIRTRETGDAAVL